MFEGLGRKTAILLWSVVLAGCHQDLMSADGGSLIIVSGKGQVGVVNTPLPQDVGVRVVDGDGIGLAGRTVTFSIQAGGGSVSPLQAVTDFNGLATAQWTLGPGAGENLLRAESAALPAATVSAMADFTLFDVELRFLTTVTEEQRAAFESAATRWRRTVTGELSDVPLTASAGECGANSPALDETIDDLVIFVFVEPIDGPNGSLGVAGPCFIRTSNSLPVVGLMRLDQADLNSLEQDGDLERVILHEMGHALGFGTLWDAVGLLADPTETGGTDPHFTGTAAVDAFDNSGGAGYSGAKVPVENSGGDGTRDGHWRESIFDTELMTGFLDANQLNPLSDITIGSLEDLGYAVNRDAADPFNVSLSAAGARLHNTQRIMTGDIYAGPIRYVADDGPDQRR